MSRTMSKTSVENKNVLEIWDAYCEYWSKEAATKETIQPDTFYFPGNAKKTPSNKWKMLKECWPCADKWSVHMIQELWLNDKPTFIALWKLAYREKGADFPLVHLMAMCVALHVRGQSEWTLNNMD